MTGGQMYNRLVCLKSFFTSSTVKYNQILKMLHLKIARVSLEHMCHLFEISLSTAVKYEKERNFQREMVPKITGLEHDSPSHHFF